MTEALYAVLYGLAAPGSPELVQVDVRGPGRSGGASGSLATWLDAAREGVKAGRQGWSPSEAMGGLPSGAKRIVLAAGGEGWAAVPESGRGELTVLGPSTSGPLGEACAEHAGCRRYDPTADMLEAAGGALTAALGGVPGVRVTVTDRVDATPGVERLVAIAPGDAEPSAPSLGEGRAFPEGEAKSKRVVTARVWTSPPVGEHRFVGPDGEPVRVLAVVVHPAVIVTDCSLIDDDAVRWRFASPGVEWSEALAARIGFNVRYRDATGEVRRQRVAPSGPGVVELPEAVTGRFTIMPVTTSDPPVVLGERSDCQPAARALTARLVVNPDDGGLRVRAVFTDAGGAVVPPAAVIEATRPSVTLDSGASAPLKLLEDRAEARFDDVEPGRHLVVLEPAATRRMKVDRVEVEAEVGQPGSTEGAPWQAALLAVILVIVLEAVRPRVVSLVRRRRPRPRGTIALYVGDALVNERVLDQSTAYPVLLAGIRELPIARGEVLARAEVVWDGWRPSFRAIVLGRRDEETGHRRMRVESCPLSGAAPFEFSNARVEFIAAG